ncbi:hypothetical protein Tco_1487031, partial [Tanacetum coccineum]
MDSTYIYGLSVDLKDMTRHNAYVVWYKLQEARALLGRLEYQRGNVKSAFRVFDSIDVQAPIQRLQSISTEKIPKKACSHTDSELSGPHQGANLVLEAIYLKTKSLQKLDRIN